MLSWPIIKENYGREKVVTARYNNRQVLEAEIRSMTLKPILIFKASSTASIGLATAKWVEPAKSRPTTIPLVKR